MNGGPKPSEKMHGRVVFPALRSQPRGFPGDVPVAGDPATAFPDTSERPRRPDDGLPHTPEGPRASGAGVRPGLTPAATAIPAHVRSPDHRHYSNARTLALASSRYFTARRPAPASQRRGHGNAGAPALPVHRRDSDAGMPALVPSRFSRRPRPTARLCAIAATATPVHPRWPIHRGYSAASTPVLVSSRFPAGHGSLGAARPRGHSADGHSIVATPASDHGRRCIAPRPPTTACPRSLSPHRVLLALLAPGGWRHAR